MNEPKKKGDSETDNDSCKEERTSFLPDTKKPHTEADGRDERRVEPEVVE